MYLYLKYISKVSSPTLPIDLKMSPYRAKLLNARTWDALKTTRVLVCGNEYTTLKLLGKVRRFDMCFNSLQEKLLTVTLVTVTQYRASWLQ